MHAVTGRAGEGVVVVVPTFTHGEQAEQPVVPAGIGGFEGALSKGVTDRVDRPSDVLVHEEANKSAPDQTSKSAEEHRLSEVARSQASDDRGDGHTDKNPKPEGIMDKENDRIFQEGSGIALDIRLEIVENPSGVGMPEAFERAMGIFLFIRVGVMLDVGGCPVKGGALHGHRTANEKEGFQPRMRLEAFVG